LQVDDVDRWVWKVHSSNKYTVSRVYYRLTEEDDHVINDNGHLTDNHLWWLKVVPLKVSLFAWCLLLNRVPTRDNLLIRRCVLSPNDQSYMRGCELNEDKDNLFVNYYFYRKIWSAISYWLGVSTAAKRNLPDHLT